MPYSRFSSIGFFPFLVVNGSLPKRQVPAYSQWVSHFYSFLADSWVRTQGLNVRKPWT